MKFLVISIFIVVCFDLNEGCVNGGERLRFYADNFPKPPINSIIHGDSYYGAEIWKEEMDRINEHDSTYEMQLGTAVRLCTKDYAVDNTGQSIVSAAENAQDVVSTLLDKTNDKIEIYFDELKDWTVSLSVVGFNDLELKRKSVVDDSTDKNCGKQVAKAISSEWKKAGFNCIAQGVTKGQTFAIQYGYRVQYISIKFTELVSRVNNEDKGLTDAEVVQNIKNWITFATEELRQIRDRDGEFVTDLYQSSIIISECLADVIEQADDDIVTVKEENATCF